MRPLRPACLMLAAGFVAAWPVRAADSSREPASPLDWSVRAARSAMARADGSLEWGAPGAKWDYTPAVFALALVRLSEATNDPSFERFAERAVGSFVSPDGQIRTYQLEELSLDQINPGKVVLALAERSGGAGYRAAAQQLRHQLAVQPRTSDGAFWHKKRYPDQMWLDGVYMASPFLAEYALRFRQPSDFDEVVRQIRLAGAHMYDSHSGLYRHGWDESRRQSWADPKTGVSPCCWSRAIGWYGMAMVDALDYLPVEHPGRAEVLTQLRRLAAGVVRHQDPKSGVWYQVTDQEARPGNYLEASGSAMFVYTLAKGVNRGYLAQDLVPAIRRGYAGLLRQFARVDEAGQVSIEGICQVAGLGYGRDGSFAYYLREPVVANDYKGVGPFIMTGIEVAALRGGR